jgi:hypothetical protein
MASHHIVRVVIFVGAVIGVALILLVLYGCPGQENKEAGAFGLRPEVEIRVTQ